jgi:hypothetical protein
MRRVKSPIYPSTEAPTLQSVEVTGDYEVRVTFSDGLVVDADLADSFVDPSGRPLGAPPDFAIVSVDTESDCLVWPDRFHVHGELLRAELQAANN